MIRKDGHAWTYLSDSLKYGGDQIIRVYHGGTRIYPRLQQSGSFVGLKIDGTYYYAPNTIYIPGTETETFGAFKESFNPSSAPVLRSRIQPYNTDYKIYSGIHEIATSMVPTLGHCTRTFASSTTNTASFSVKDVETGETITETFPYIGKTYFPCVVPIIDRYMLATAWIKKGYESLLPSWMQGYDEYDSDFKPGTVGANPMGSRSSSAAYGGRVPIICGSYLYREKFASGIAFPKGATLLTGGIVGSNDGLMGHGVPFSLTESCNMEGTAVGYSGGCVCAASATGVANIIPATIVGSGATDVRCSVGTMTTLTSSYNLTCNITGTAFGKTEEGKSHILSMYADLYSGSTKVGQVWYTIDNVVKRVTIRNNFLWYEGILKEVT